MASEHSLFSASTASFEAPLEMLAACHGRIEGQCSTLLRLESHVATASADAAARSAARNVLRYFDQAGRNHHEDEEQDLFPAMLESIAGSDPVCIRELVDALQSDHRELDRLWSRVKAWLAAVEADQAPPSAGDAIGAFVALNRRHIAREDEELLPMAARLLGSEELDRIGRSMRLRRGIRSG